MRDDAFLADVVAAESDIEKFHLWWLGQSGFLVKWNGRHLLLDPYLSDSLTHKYAGTEKPHVRMTERVVEPERLDFIDVATSSHNHTDHLDGETLMPLLARNPQMVLLVPEANRAFAAERLEVPESRLMVIDEGQSFQLDGFTFHAIAAAHETVERDKKGRMKHLGYVVEFGTWCFYHSGDTVLYDGLIAQLRQFSIDVALLPINGRVPERGVPGNLSGPEAAELAHSIGAGLVIPCHYEMFEFNTVAPDAFVATAQRIKQPFCILRCGERRTFCHPA